ncbi:MAG: M14 family metallopeptidase [Gemmatimonadaceae bacterium]
MSHRCSRRLASAMLVLVIGYPMSGRAQGVPSPKAALGFDVGADRTLADWPQITRYFSALAASPAVHVDTLGPTTNGQPFILAAVSSPENIRRLPEIRANQALLADPRKLDDATEQRLMREQPSVLLISCNIHASEIGSSQMVMELAYRLATNDTLQALLRHTVVLLIPSMNPDGQLMITDWYRKNLNTAWEGGPLPWLYHPYVGHDNNRDWYMVTQKETRLVTDMLYRSWFPEVIYDVHQMGNEGMRLFVPPMVDPVNPNLDPMIVRGINLAGATMSFALEEEGKSGVGDGVLYDMWWHGGFRSTPTRHNMIALLTEAASVRVATPIEQEPSSLKGHSRGLPRYEQRVSFPNPWPGGWWRLRDIVEYERIAAEALVKLAADERERFVRGMVQMGRRQIALGASTGPRAFVIPKAQRDPGATRTLLKTLQVGGVEIHESATDYVIRMDQPYRAHAKDLLEAQNFPKMERWPGGPVERPYDVAGWTLSYQTGVTVRAANEAPSTPLKMLPPVETTACTRWSATGAKIGKYTILDARDTESYRLVMQALRAGWDVRQATERYDPHLNDGGYPSGSFYVARRGGPPTAVDSSLYCRPSIDVLPRHRVLKSPPRVALYRSWTASMDEGWTRWVFDQHAVSYVSVTDSTIRAGKLRDQYDVILVPDMSLRDARVGMLPSAVPPQYAGGLGDEGLSQLKTFVEAGGTLILLDRASEIGTAVLGVPVQRITVPGRIEDDEVSEGVGSGGRRREPLYAPGSVLRTLVDTSQRITAGLPDTAAVYFTNSVTFDVSPGSTVRPLLRYPDRSTDILMSGYLSGAPEIAGKAAAVAATVGQGRVVMFGFRVQYRGQSVGTFKLLFNALLDGVTPAQR